MARAFNGSSHYLSRTAFSISEPFTMACHFRADDITNAHTLMSFGNNGANGMWRIAAMGSVTGDPIRAQKQDDISTTTTVDTTTGYSANTWHHACGVFISNTSRKVYLDGGSSASDTTSISDPTPDYFSIGVLQRSGFAQYLAGRTADCAIWNVELTQAEIAAHSDGVPAYLIRPDALVFYAPLHGLESPEIDLSGNAYNMTVTGATKANHAPIELYTRYRFYIEDIAAAAGGRVMGSLAGLGGLAGYGGLAGKGGGLAG